MRVRNWWCFLILFLFLNGISFGAECPSKESLQAALRKAFPRIKSLQVEKISPSKELKGFCEAVVSTGGPFKSIIYVDSKGHYALLGRLLDLRLGKDLSREKIMTLSRLKPAQLKKLEELVAFSVGQGTKIVYLITDPDCPFCKRLEKTLDEFLKEGKLTVKVVLFPLERLHPKAKAKSVALICDHKGWQELLDGYTSANQCEEGKRKIEATREFLSSLGIRGTPALVLTDGRIIQGALPKAQLTKILGL